MTYFMIAALLLIVLLQAMSKLSLPHLLVAAMLAAILSYPLVGKHLMKAESPRQAYRVVKTATADQQGGVRTYEFNPPYKGLKSRWCEWWNAHDKRKEGPIRDRIRKACEAQTPKEKKQ